MKYAIFVLLLLAGCGKKEIYFPEADAIDKTDRCWQANNTIYRGHEVGDGTPDNPYRTDSTGSQSYHRVEVSPGKWQWVSGEEPNWDQADPDCEGIYILDYLPKKAQKWSQWLASRSRLSFGLAPFLFCISPEFRGFSA